MGSRVCRLGAFNPGHVMTRLGQDRAVSEVSKLRFWSYLRDVLGRGSVEGPASGVLDGRLMEVLVCPSTHETLRYDPLAQEMVADQAGLAYPVVDGIPVLLAGEAHRPGERRGAPILDEAGFGQRYDSIMDSRAMRALYGDSGYFNVGYWAAGTGDLVEACDRLVDAVAAAIPADSRLIVDAGCGVGAATLRLAGHFPEAIILAVNLSHRQLLEARRRGVGMAAVMDAARLGMASASADAVVALESPQHFDTRAAFLSEAERVLRPGGTIVLADMLYSDRPPVGAWMHPPANAVSGLDDYARGMTEAGFEAVEVRDATDMCWRPYCRALRAVSPGREEVVDGLESAFSHYVIASARKPCLAGGGGSDGGG
jgi:MPBQ/MSBQ methyltransferase